MVRWSCSRRGYVGAETRRFDGGFQAPGGLYHFGARIYDPLTGAWTQPDPQAQSLAQDPTQTDAYAFAGDDPVNNVDPTGHNIIKTLKKKTVKFVKKMGAPVAETMSTAEDGTASWPVSGAESMASTGSSAYHLASDVYEATTKFVEGSGADAIGGCVGLGYAVWKMGPYAAAGACVAGGTASYFGVDLSDAYDSAERSYYR